MHHLLYGILAPPPPPERVVVKADNVVCRASNVDITEHSCVLTFGHRTVELKGRRAHELYATIDEVGVPPDGAAGSVFESLSKLDCTIDPKEIAQRAGGGASCTFDAARKTRPLRARKNDLAASRPSGAKFGWPAEHGELGLGRPARL